MVALFTRGCWNESFDSGERAVFFDYCCVSAYTASYHLPSCALFAKSVGSRMSRGWSSFVNCGHTHWEENRRGLLKNSRRQKRREGQQCAEAYAARTDDGIERWTHAYWEEIIEWCGRRWSANAAMVSGILTCIDVSLAVCCGTDRRVVRRRPGACCYRLTVVAVRAPVWTSCTAVAVSFVRLAAAH